MGTSYARCWVTPTTARDPRFRHGPEKIFLREGTPELASPCRLFGRRNQTALAPYKAILKQRCVAFQRQSEGIDNA